MELANRINQSKWSIRAAMAVVFLLMLLLNFLTPYAADDYVYRLSFATKEPLQNLEDVAKSMYVHCYRMNGRVVSHTLEQLFMLVPKAVFNACNAGVFLLLMYLMYRVANCGRRRNAVLFLGIAAAFWKFLPAFGQVALWQVGSLNYLWGLAGGMVFLLPFVRRYINGRDGMRGWMRVIFIAASVLLGMYTEVTSFIVIFLGILLLAVSAVQQHQSWKSWLWIPLGAAGAGYGIMLQIPAEMQAKQGTLTLQTLLNNFNTATEMLAQNLMALLIIWGCCFTLGILFRVDQKRLTLSALFAFGAVAANYMLTVAAYFPARCLCTSCMLLILASAMLVTELHQEQFLRAVRACAGVTLAIVFVFSLVAGCYDICRTDIQVREREQMIEEMKAAGERDLVLPCIYGETKYSAFWNTTDLNTETSDTWPNTQMAKYYGVDSILGQ